MVTELWVGRLDAKVLTNVNGADGLQYEHWIVKVNDTPGLCSSPLVVTRPELELVDQRWLMVVFG